MRLLDLYCGQGGAAMGYHRAGYEVTGIDITDQPRYPFRFIQADALDYLREHGRDYDAIHASPPCQHYSDLAHRTGRDYPVSIAKLRALLRQLEVAVYIIENVEKAPLHHDVLLCGTMFSGLRVLRHRRFEVHWHDQPTRRLAQPAHPPHPRVYDRSDKRKAHHGLLDQDTAYVQVTGGGNCTAANARDAMGIDWMTKQGLNQAIPPAYTEWLGRQLQNATTGPCQDTGTPTR